MAMRDPKEWAAWIINKAPLNEAFDEDFFARLIREAQEDGARAERDVNVEINAGHYTRVMHAEAQVAALTERAERAERVARSYASWISGESEEEIDQGRADFLMSKMDEFILKLKKEKP